MAKKKQATLKAFSRDYALDFYLLQEPQHKFIEEYITSEDIEMILTAYCQDVLKNGVSQHSLPLTLNGTTESLYKLTEVVRYHRERMLKHVDTQTVSEDSDSKIVYNLREFKRYLIHEVSYVDFK